MRSITIPGELSYRTRDGRTLVIPIMNVISEDGRLDVQFPKKLEAKLNQLVKNPNYTPPEVRIHRDADGNLTCDVPDLADMFLNWDEIVEQLLDEEEQCQRPAN